MCDCNRDGEMDRKKPPAKADQKKISRRRALKTVGVSGLTTMCVGVGAVSTVSAHRPVRSETKGSFTIDGSALSIDIDIVDMTSEDWDPGEDVLEGMAAGFSILYDRISMFNGFRVRLFDPDYVYDGEVSRDALWDALSEDNDFTRWKHYHVLYDDDDLDGSFHNGGTTWTGDRTLWDDDLKRGISGLSMGTTDLSQSTPTVRGLHQAMHLYLHEDEAKKFADTTDGYDAVHQLGTKNSSTGYNSIMTDIYSIPAMEGDCSSHTYGKSPRMKDHLWFSDCAITTVYDSMARNM